MSSLEMLSVRNSQTGIKRKQVVEKIDE